MPIYRFIQKKVFVPDPDGNTDVTAEDLNQISEALIEAQPLAPDAVPAWFRYEKLFSDFATAGLSSSIKLLDLDPAGLIHAIKVKHSQAFAGGAIATYTVKVGIAGTLDKYCAAVNVFDAPGDANYDVNLPAAGKPTGESHTVATEILITADATGANLDAATAGAVELWVQMSRAATPA